MEPDCVHVGFQRTGGQVIVPNCRYRGTGHLLCLADEDTQDGYSGYRFCL